MTTSTEHDYDLIDIRIDTAFYVSVDKILKHEHAPKKDCWEDYIGKELAFATWIVTEMQKQFVSIYETIGESEEGLERAWVDEMLIGEMVYLDFVGDKKNEGKDEILDEIEAVFEKFMAGEI